jgi:hypothetical protein
LGEPQLGHQTSAECKLRFYLGLWDVYFGSVYSAGSETERVALKKRSETQNRSTLAHYRLLHSNLTTKHVFAPAQCHTRHLQHPLTPPRAAGLNRVRTRVRSLQQAPSRQAARCSAAEAPAAGSPGPAGSPQAARRHVRAAVSDLDCSLPAPRRPSGSGSAGAMSRVGGALPAVRASGLVQG